ncbi:MAG TPA: UDP-N-acetylmuramate--L-alanine ligase [Clostridiaceae bacterium]|nr:UDP-N-acetylmuramate--L-alanine ligase [Clostridiaceae bacterium]
MGEGIPNISQLSDLPRGADLYFIGIGGISMCGLAEMAKHLGYHIAGSDRQASDHTHHLAALGVAVNIGHDAANIDRAVPQLVIHTAAVPADNPELKRAHELGIPVVERAVFLGWITRDFKRVINIAGTHGKTTTTAMCALILLAAKADPTVHLGAELSAFDHSTVRMGKSHDLLISEACEYANSYHHFESTTAVILNIDLDHMDFFEDATDLVNSFAIFTDQIRDGGYLILPHSGRFIPELVACMIKRRQATGRSLPTIVTYGTEPTGEFDKNRMVDVDFWPDTPTVCYRNLNYDSGIPEFDIYIDGTFWTSIHLNIPGTHNVANATAAIAATYINGADAESVGTVLRDFSGAEGRYTVKGRYLGATVVSDYAHHPAATVATIEAAKATKPEHIWVVYQPLTFGRVKLFFEQYVEALLPCEHTLFVEIYSDREATDFGMSSKLIKDEINRRGGSAEFVPSYEAVVERLSQLAGSDDIILFLGPEQVRSFADRLVLEPGGEPQQSQ